MTEIELALVEYDGSSLPYADLVYQALKAMQERGNGCPVCQAPYNFNCTIKTQRFNDGTILSLRLGVDNSQFIHAHCSQRKDGAKDYSFATQIKFCPMCGKELKP